MTIHLSKTIKHTVQSHPNVCFQLKVCFDILNCIKVFNISVHQMIYNVIWSWNYLDLMLKYCSSHSFYLTWYKQKKYESGSCMLFEMLSFCSKNTTVQSCLLKQSTKSGLTSHPQARLESAPLLSKILTVS